MAEAHWNQPELVQAFKDWRDGRVGLEDQRLLESPALPRYVEDLYVGTRNLLDERDVTAEYRFSDAAMQSVRQDREIYLRDASVPKCEIFLASVILLPEGDMRFARMYNTRLSADDIFRRLVLDERSLESLTEGGSFHLGHPYSTEQHVDILYGDMEREPGGAIVRRYPPGTTYPEGGTERFDPEITVADYITLGHMIRYDLEH